MLKQNELTYAEQKKIKPRVEDAISDYLDGETKEIALDFVAYMRANKLSPMWASCNSWKASCKSKAICYVKVFFENKHPWFIIIDLAHISSYEEEIIREGLQDFVWENLNYCSDCSSNGKCDPKGRNITICGKELKNICRWRINIQIYDLNQDKNNYTKRLLEFEKKARLIKLSKLE